MFLYDYSKVMNQRFGWRPRQQPTYTKIESDKLNEIYALAGTPTCAKASQEK
jgi:hypothetical protein